MSQKEPKGWEEEFSKKFTDHVLKNGYGNDMTEDQASPIMKFITSLLTQKAEEIYLKLNKNFAYEGSDLEFYDFAIQTVQEVLTGNEK